MEIFHWQEDGGLRSEDTVGGSLVFQAASRHRASDSYSCESMYMQCYDLSDSAESDDPEVVTDYEPVVRSSKESVRRRDRKHPGRAGGIRSDDERASLSYSLQARNRGNPASWENIFQNDRNAALVSPAHNRDGGDLDRNDYHTKDQTGRGVSQNGNRSPERPQWDAAANEPATRPEIINKYGRYPDDITRVNTAIKPQITPLDRYNENGGYPSEITGFPRLPEQTTAQVHQVNSNRPTNTRVDALKDATNPSYIAAIHQGPGQTSMAQAHRMNSNNTNNNLTDAKPDATIPNFSGPIRRFNSRHPDSVLASERESVITAATNFSAESGGSSQMVSDTVVQDASGEMALDAFKMSKTEIVDRMYRDRKDDDEQGEQRWLWISCKVLTWTVLCLAAATALICAKLSLAAITNALLISTNVSEVLSARTAPGVVGRPMSLQLPIHTNRPNPTTVHTGMNESTMVSKNITRYNGMAQNMTFSVIPALVGSDSSGYAAPDLVEDSCELQYHDLLASQNRSLSGFLQPSWYENRQGVYVDVAALFMLFLIVVIPPTLGLVVGIYGFIRWEGVRRARLTWRAFILVSIYRQFLLYLDLFTSQQNMCPVLCYIIRWRN